MMGHTTFNGWLQIALYGVLLIAAHQAARRLHDARLCRRAHRAFAGAPSAGARHLLALRHRRGREQHWVAYAIAMLAFSFVGFVLLYAIQRLQGMLPLNPQGFGR